MNENRRRKRSSADRRMLLLVIAAFVAIVAIGVFAFLRFYNSYIDGTLYRERLKQMQEVTTQLFSGLEDVVQSQWETTDTFCNYLTSEQPQTDDALLEFMQEQAALNRLDKKGAHLIAVDNLGRYLTEEGWQGALTEMNLLMNEPKKLSFVSKPLTNNKTYMNFLQRLDEPISFSDGNRSVELLYYGICRDMDQLNPYFTCEAYDDSNSVYVLDNQGMRLFRSSSSSSLLEGYNAYSTLERMEYLHDNSFAEALHDLETVGHGYANAILEGEEYYYAMYQMDHAEWVLLFLVPSSYVATDVVAMVSMTVRMILVFALILIVLAVLVVILLMNFKQKQAVDAERQNSEQLETLNTELEAASKAKSDFLANMSHDIRTPMNAIVGIANLMQHENELPAQMQNYISKIQMSSQHLLSLINDVLDMSKIESSEVVLNAEPVDLSEVVWQVDSIIRSQTSERGQTFRILVHEVAHEHVITDGVRLRQLLINLLSNATKYTPAGGDIRFDLAELPCDQPEHATYQIRVADNGYGMEPEFVEHIFEPFTRAENSTTNKVQGTGLGMAIAKSIVDLVGGEITVDSEPGKGSTFTVTLTLAIDRNAEMEADVRAALLVCNDAVLARNVSASMREARIALHIAGSVDEAQALLATENADVVLLNGLDYDDTLAERVNALRSAAKEDVLIYCVDYAQPEQAANALAGSGVNGLIPRPFFLSNLLRAVDQARGAAAPEDANATVLQGLKFLCAEDNSLNAEILTALLTMEGASCTICRNGQEIVDAFERVKPGEYDAILMDVQMPVMNGLDAARAIRASRNPLGKSIPILAMTANAFSEDVQNSMAAGMDAHISKPIDIKVLEREMSRFVAPPESARRRRKFAQREHAEG